MEIPEESEEDVKMWPSSDDVIKEIKDKRAMQVEDWLETNTLEVELKKQKKVVFITPTQNLVEQQATTIEAYTNLCVGRYHGG